MPPLLDDRDQPIRQIDLRALSRAEGDRGAARLQTARRLKAAVKAESQRWSLFNLAYSILAVAVVIGASILTTILVPGSPACVVVFVASAVLVVFVSRRLASGRMNHALAASAVAEGYCGQCCYDLRGQVPDSPDGCIACPECGAAWKATRLTAAPAPDATNTAQRRITEPMPEFTSAERWRHRGLRLVGLLSSPGTRQTPDDRGRLVPVPDILFFAVPASVRTTLAPTRIRSIKQLAARPSANLRLVLGILLTAIAVTIILGAISLFTTPSELRLWWFAMIVVAAILLPTIVGAVFLFMGFALVRPAHIAAALTYHGLCGCCLRELAQLAPDADGLITCPRCGSAWTPRAHPPLATPPDPDAPPTTPPPEAQAP